MEASVIVIGLLFFGLLSLGFGYYYFSLPFYFFTGIISGVAAGLYLFYFIFNQSEKQKEQNRKSNKKYWWLIILLGAVAGPQLGRYIAQNTTPPLWFGAWLFGILGAFLILLGFLPIISFLKAKK